MSGYYTALPCVLGVVGPSVLGAPNAMRFIDVRWAYLYSHWWPATVSAAFTLAYGLAAWRIERRDRRGGILALALFAWRMVPSLWMGHFHFGLSHAINALYGVFGIMTLWRLAEALQLRPNHPRSASSEVVVS